MKILLLNQTFYPDRVATAQQITDLAEWLEKKGHQVTVFTSMRAYNDPSKMHPKYEKRGNIEINRLWTPGVKKNRFRYRFLEGLYFEFFLLLKLLFFPRQDLTISFTSPPLLCVVGYLFTRIKGGESVQWLMDINPDIAIAVGYLKETSLFSRSLKLFHGIALRNSNWVVVLDKWMKKKIEERYGVKSEHICIVPPWPLSINEEKVEGKEFRKKHGLQEKFLVMFSGNHSIVHPLTTLLQTALKMRDKKNTCFVFIGGGHRTGEVKDFIKQHELKNILQIEYQPREDLLQSLASANLHVVILGDAVSGLVHVSKIYGVMATGRPYVYIGAKESHIGDLQKTCPTGYWVKTGDVKGLETVIEEAKNLSEEKRTSIADKNILFIQDNYKIDKCLQSFYKEILQKENTVEKEIQVPSRA